MPAALSIAGLLTTSFCSQHSSVPIHIHSLPSAKIPV
jgi:hypothetical protein